MIRLSLLAVMLLLVLPTVASEQNTAATPHAPLPTAGVTEKITFTEVNVDGPYIAMTFDDGPHATNTPKLLEMAAKRHIKLTFFVLGECVEQNPTVLQREVAKDTKSAITPGRILILRSSRTRPSTVSCREP